MSKDLKEMYKLGFWIPLVFVVVIFIKIIFFPQTHTKVTTEIIPSINEATSTAYENDIYQPEEQDLKAAPTEEQNQELSLKRCTNDFHSFSILYTNKVMPKIDSEIERCMNLALLVNEEDLENTAIKLRTVEAGIDDLAEEITASLGDIKIENFEVDNGYNSKIIKGTWPAESINSGNKYLAFLVENRNQYILVFEAKDELTENEYKIFEDIIKTLKFL